MEKTKAQQQASGPAAAQKVATLAILIAVTALFTYVVRIPIAPTRGYINFGDVAIFFSAILFGPFTAFISGGLGTALADLISGYAQWAPFSFLAHGLQGLFIGLIFKVGRDGNASAAGLPSVARLLIAFVVATLTMGGIYFLVGGVMVGFPAAATEIPGNILQNLVGVLVGSPLALAVMKAYPPVRRSFW
ncbi:MAG TPA: ECF transporter S component [Sediminispirochaeta sp.]|nr:ECF transporter S component [Sediminispirochaeta sp.]